MKLEQLKERIETDTAYRFIQFKGIFSDYLALKFLERECEIIIKQSRHGWSVEGYLGETQDFAEYCAKSGDVVAVLDRNARHYGWS